MKNLINKFIEKFFTREVISYLVFGVLTTLVNFVFYWLFTEVLGIYYLTSNVIAWIFAVIFAYITNKLFVFESKSWELPIVVKEVLSFGAARILSLLFETGFLNSLEAGSFSALAAIHKFLFEDIYDFAGQIRTVNIAKGSFRFVPALYLSDALESISKMPQNTFDEIIAKYVEMNVAHPFREGNGRSTRIWLDHILKTELHLVIDWSKIDKEDYLLAMERSPIKDTEIKLLLKSALTDKINDRDVYMKGIDASYNYEGYNTYKTENLNK